MTENELLTALGSRQGLDDARLFVGRREHMRRCTGLGSPNTRVVWVSGARRIGKTAFSQHLARRFAESHENAKVISVDVSGTTTFDDLLSNVLDRAGFGSSGTPRERFEAYADASRRGVSTLLVLDEFDRMAVSLGADEQGLLRRLSTDERKLSYIFVSHIDPVRLVEEVSDVASRLLGIALPVRMPILAQSDVQELFQCVSNELGIPEVAATATWAWEEIGGHPVSIMTILQKVAIAALDGERTFDGVLDELRTELGQQMSSLWRDLLPATRAVLLDEGTTPEARGDASSEGFISRLGGAVRPRRLVELCRVAGANSFGSDDVLGDPTTVLHDTIYEINAWAKTKKGTAWFGSTDETRRQHRTRRASRTEDEFSAVVNHLYKVVYEAARELDPARNSQSDPMRWRIPEEYRAVFTGSEGMKALKAYRAFFDHDPDFGRTDDDKHDRHMRVGKAFKRACGVEKPATAEHWARAHGRLMTDLVAAVGALLQLVRAST